jgi:hypothetical protein
LKKIDFFSAISFAANEPLVLTNVVNIAKIHCEGLGRFSLLSSALSQPFLFFAHPNDVPQAVSLLHQDHAALKNASGG